MTADQLAEKLRQHITAHQPDAIVLRALSDLRARANRSDRLAAALERERDMVRRMARFGVGPGTTPERALETIAVWAENKIAREALVSQEQP